MAIEFLVVFIPMFIIIDPFGVLPIFLVLTRDMDPKARLKTLRYSVSFALLLLIAFALGGNANHRRPPAAAHRHQHAL